MEDVGVLDTPAPLSGRRGDPQDRRRSAHHPPLRRVTFVERTIHDGAFRAKKKKMNFDSRFRETPRVAAAGVRAVLV